MGEQKFVFWFNVIVGPLLGGFAAYWVAASVLGEYSWCIAGEEHCVREWAGALSGWAAAAGALLAVLITIPYLRKQIAEAQRQSDFLVGDAPPEFIVQRNRDHGTVTLIVRNWNRRRVMVDDAKTVGGNGIVVSSIGEFHDEEFSKTLVARPDGRRSSYGVDGWIDRSESPPDRKLYLFLSRGEGSINTPDVVAANINLLIEYRLVGQEHEERTASVSALEIIEV